MLEAPHTAEHFINRNTTTEIKISTDWGIRPHRPKSKPYMIMPEFDNLDGSRLQKYGASAKLSISTLLLPWQRRETQTQLSCDCPNQQIPALRATATTPLLHSFKKSSMISEWSLCDEAFQLSIFREYNNFADPWLLYFAMELCFRKSMWGQWWDLRRESLHSFQT